MSTPDDERISYLSGERVDALTPQERAELDELRTLLQSPATWEEPDAALEDLVVNAIATEARRAPAPAQAPAPAKAPEPKKASIWSRWRPRRPALALGGLATAAAAIAVALVIALGSGNGAQPLRFAMVVSGTQLAPQAHGNATLTKTESGWRIELSATGTAAPGKWPLLPGVAEEPGRDPRPGRHVQRRQAGHALVGRSGHPVPRLQRHRAVGQRQPRLLGAPGARRHRPPRALTSHPRTVCGARP